MAIVTLVTSLFFATVLALVALGGMTAAVISVAVVFTYVVIQPLALEISFWNTCIAMYGVLGFLCLLYPVYKDVSETDENLAELFDHIYNRKLASLQGDEDGEEQQAEEGNEEARQAL